MFGVKVLRVEFSPEEFGPICGTWDQICVRHKLVLLFGHCLLLTKHEGQLIQGDKETKNSDLVNIKTGLTSQPFHLQAI